ncbi:ABC transporter permease subunit [Terrarubrum flagellatum]|uniref:ABC transporter permease subunit n=1 Tax=Terrirubrum flagellatum TaxID=2895980 RepID=UPI003144F38C
MNRDGPSALTAPAPIRRWPHPGIVVAALLIALFAYAILSLASHATSAGFAVVFSPYVGSLLQASLIQVSLSTLLSLLLGALVALAVARRGNHLVARAFRAFLLTAAVAPTIVLVLGVVTVYGRAGWAAAALQSIGVGSWPSIYGLPGILIAHVALNASYAARIYLHALDQVPPEHHRIAAIYGLSPAQIFRQCDWPALKRETPGLAALIMLLCFTSFAVVLTLGGGPRYATLEVAIYEALRVEVDFGRAGLLAILQVAISAAFVLATGRMIRAEPVGETSGRAIARADAAMRGLRIADVCVLALVAACLAPVLFAPLGGITAASHLIDRDVAQAFMTSITVAVPASALCVLFALALATHSVAAPRGAFFAAAPMLALAVPPFALIAGLYVPLRRFADMTTLAYVLTPLVNAIIALPFAFRLIEPAARLSRARYGKLAAQLGLSGLNHLRIVDAPILRRPVIAAFAMALALSLGDFGVAALFGGEEFRTLPLLLNERMGAYRMAEAQAVALVMIIFAFLLALATETFADAGDR